MKKIKVIELSGALLDLSVAQAEALNEDWRRTHFAGAHIRGTRCVLRGGEFFSPSKLWGLGGPIIERCKINIFQERGMIFASIKHDGYLSPQVSGHTPLIAAMRAYVASVFGAEIEEPQA